ncbi:hypothetical protein ACJ72_01326 [Emergomyces africanus]|uniref:Uncharacterized protein n=1 Tax=Emergomyces africanus TaxID=1955775 RepID=A0A1B7P5J5_9EURO|nr:hypothetical protein ACJ72_01326 [Emergomyces africanus]
MSIRSAQMRREQIALDHDSNMSQLNLKTAPSWSGSSRWSPTSLEGSATFYLPRPSVELVDQLLASRDQIMFRLSRRVVAHSFHQVSVYLLMIFLDYL